MAAAEASGKRGLDVGIDLRLKWRIGDGVSITWTPLVGPVKKIIISKQVKGQF